MDFQGPQVVRVRQAHVGPPNGDEALPLTRVRDDGELCATKSTLDTEAGTFIGRHISEERAVDKGANEGSSSWLTRLLAVLKTLPAATIARAWARGLLLALPCSTGLCALGALAPEGIWTASPSRSGDLSLNQELLASLAGAPVAMLAAVVSTYLVLRRLHGLEGVAERLDDMVNINMIGVCSSVTAIPLGFAMFGFGVWDALAVTVAGLGALMPLFYVIVALVCVLLLLLTLDDAEC